MRLTVKLKLLLLVCAALLALGLVVGVSESISQKQQAALDDAENRLVPRLELGPRLQADFALLRQSIQDAVAAQDAAALENTMATKTRIFDAINGAGAALEPSLAASLRWAVQDYFETARSVSRRLIAQETGEDILQGMREMQERQKLVESAIRKAAGLDRTELTSTFSVVRAAGASATRIRFGLGAGAVVVVLFLWLWASSQVLRALGRLSEGFRRFEQGELTHTVVVDHDDELGDVTRDANRLAASLHHFEQRRVRDDWIKDGVAEISARLRGNLEPDAVAENVLSFLARRVGAVAGALYLADENGRLTLLRQLAGSDESARPVIEPGEGLVGRAFVDGEVRVVSSVPSGHWKVRSALGDSEPNGLLFVPLANAERSIGIVELALFGELDERVFELVDSIRSMVVVVFEAALGDRARRRLLAETQEQAERLAAQEEELRVNNQELLAQRTELEGANDELEAQKLALAERNEEIEKARRVVQEKAEELARVSLYKSQFLANMSHELRTPLNSMLLLSHLLAENENGNLTTKQVEYCSTIHSAGEDLLGLINQVLDLSKIESGKQELELERVPLSAFVDHARHIFEPLAVQKGLSLVVEVAEGLPSEITTDRRRVERILTNLLGNAIKFTERGEVRLRLGRPSAGAHLGPKLAPNRTISFVVSDTGIGIPASEHERVFAAFEQIEAKSDRRYQGTGLGLAIARESAQLLGGELGLESVVGRGSTFTLLVPEREAGDEVPVHTVKPRANDVAVTSEAYVLIVEDDPILAEQLVDLVRARGLDAVVTSSGRDALRRATEHPPRGVILDVKLPDLDGWTVMEQLKRVEATRNVPVHFLSAFENQERGLSLGAIGYLTKPASRAELSGLVRRLLPRAEGSEERILVVEDSQTEGRSIMELLASQHVESRHVTSASEALRALERERFGCVVLDLGLPDMDGLGLLEKLRERPEFIGIRVIVHTGRSLTKKETRQLEDYAQAIVLKDGNSATRLLEEVRLFVHHVGERLPAKSEPLVVEPGERDGSLTGRKILVVEDDIRTIYSLSALLRSRGCEVVVAENGKEALDALSNRPDVDLVLMDVMMPEMDGYEATRKIRAEKRFSKLPIISLTAKAMAGERDRCIEAGATDYLSKPVDGRALLAKIGQHLPTEARHAE